MVFPEYKTVKVANLVPYIRNSRTHSAEQVAQIAASIREFGFTNPLLIDEQGGDYRWSWPTFSSTKARI